MLGDSLGGILAMVALLIALVSYLCGCFNGAVIVSKYILRDDVRNHGSGNAGLTNFHRTFGGGLTVVVILTDALKAVAALWFSGVILRWFETGDGDIVFLMAKYWAALFCLLGHMFPCMFQFKGGKGILSGGAIALMIDWRIALVVWVGFIVLVALTRYVSLGSLWAGGSFPVATWILYPDQPVLIVLGFLCGGLVVWQHRGNIKRLIQGNENKFSFHRKK